MQVVQTNSNASQLGGLLGLLLGNKLNNDQQAAFYDKMAKPTTETTPPTSENTNLLTSNILPNVGAYSKDPTLNQPATPQETIRNANITDIPQISTQDMGNQIAPASLTDSAPKGFTAQLTQTAPIVQPKSELPKESELVSKSKISDSERSKAYKQIADSYRSDGFLGGLFNKGMSEEQKNMMLKDADAKIEESYTNAKKSAFNQGIDNLFTGVDKIDNPQQKEQFIIKESTKLNNLGYGTVDTNALLAANKNQFTNIYKHTEPDMSIIVYGTDKFGKHTQIAKLSPDGAVMFDQSMKLRTADQADRKLGQGDRALDLEEQKIVSNDAYRNAVLTNGGKGGTNGVSLSELNSANTAVSQLRKQIAEINNNESMSYSQKAQACSNLLRSYGPQIYTASGGNRKLADSIVNDIQTEGNFNIYSPIPSVEDYQPSDESFNYVRPEN